MMPSLLAHASSCSQFGVRISKITAFTGAPDLKIIIKYCIFEFRKVKEGLVKLRLGNKGLLSKKNTGAPNLKIIIKYCILSFEKS